MSCGPNNNAFSNQQRERNNHDDLGKCSKEICACGTTFKYNLKRISENTYDLIVTPCCQPTAVFDVARITERENSCSGLEYFQCVINCDPVKIIQDCDLCDAICRCVVIYFQNNDPITCRNNNRNGFVF